MQNFDEVINRVKILECPTGQLDKRVEQILKDHNIVQKGNANIYRDENSDRDEAEAYRVNLQDKDMVILAKSGLDDYVAKVIDVYLE